MRRDERGMENGDMEDEGVGEEERTYWKEEGRKGSAGASGGESGLRGRYEREGQRDSDKEMERERERERDAH